MMHCSSDIEAAGSVPCTAIHDCSQRCSWDMEANASVLSRTAATIHNCSERCSCDMQTTGSVLYTIQDFSPRLHYDPDSEGKALCRMHNRHMGQMKLLISEIAFLNDFADDGTIVVYVGAADGTHIPTLDSMFQPMKLCWHLFDPSRFSPEVMLWMRQNQLRVFVYRRCFYADDAAYFKGFRAVLLISDIRNKEDFLDNDSIPEETNVVQDQAMQMDWVKSMQPTACCLKFRGTFDYMINTDAEEFEYINGELRIQAWPRPNSTELRLVASRPYSYRMYSSRQLDEAMSYYNEKCRMLDGNDMKLQKHVLSMYMGNQALKVSVRDAGREAFDAFEGVYCARRGGGKII